MRFAARHAHGKYGPDATPVLCIPGSDTEGVMTSLGVEPLCCCTGSLMNVGIYPNQLDAARVSAVSWLTAHPAIYRYGVGFARQSPRALGVAAAAYRRCAMRHHQGNPVAWGCVWCSPRLLDCGCCSSSPRNSLPNCGARGPRIVRHYMRCVSAVECHDIIPGCTREPAALQHG